MQNLQRSKAKKSSSLFNLQQMCVKNGPSLSMNHELCGSFKSQVFLIIFSVFNYRVLVYSNCKLFKIQYKAKKRVCSSVFFAFCSLFFCFVFLHCLAYVSYPFRIHNHRAVRVLRRRGQKQVQFFKRNLEEKLRKCIWNF